MDKNSDQNIMDKSMRSVFVGNIPYEATEEKLKDIFSEVGPVLSLKLVFDRESGKPKGYGFCEYKDQETALSAMRNLNGYEIGGRTLRVDNACTEKSRMEMQQLLQGPQIENPYGDPVPPEKAPEVISKVVACLPPERLLQIMKEMKECIEQNPQEAKNMLLKNPQISYALLQAQVVMKVIDPKDALKFLHNPNMIPPVLDKNSIPSTSSIPTPVAGPTPLMSVTIPSMFTPVQSPMTNNFAMNQDIDMRGLPENRPLDPRLTRSNEPVPRNVIPPLIKPQSNPQPMPPITSLYPPAAMPMDPRQRPADPRVNDPRAPIPDPRITANDPRAVIRGAMPNPPMSIPAPRGGQSPLNMGAARSLMGSLSPGGLPSGATDQEKAALIMQVLQLSEEQIAMLPPEQRTSILVLKEQIAKSTNR